MKQSFGRALADRVLVYPRNGMNIHNTLFFKSGLAGVSQFVHKASSGKEVSYRAADTDSTAAVANKSTDVLQLCITKCYE